MVKDPALNQPLTNGALELGSKGAHRRRGRRQARETTRGLSELDATSEARKADAGNLPPVAVYDFTV